MSRSTGRDDRARPCLVVQGARWAVLGIAAVLAISGCASATPGTAQPNWSTPLSSYVDVTTDHPDLGVAARAIGHARFVLSFLLARGSACTPTWDGTAALDDPGIQATARTARTAGARLSVSSGGELGSYLENACTDPRSLANAYESALAVTGADQLDLDIEQPVRPRLVADAVALLLREHPVPVIVTLPLADASTGIDPAALPLLRALAADRVTVTVNAMLLDFGHGGARRDALLRAAATVLGQVATLRPTAGVGLTLMAGRDDMGAVTTLADARAVRDYADQHRLAMLGLWSLGRDNGSCPGRPDAVDTCSGVAQSPYAFARVLSGAQE